MFCCRVFITSQSSWYLTSCELQVWPPSISLSLVFPHPYFALALPIFLLYFLLLGFTKFIFKLLHQLRLQLAGKSLVLACLVQKFVKGICDFLIISFVGDLLEYLHLSKSQDALCLALCSYSCCLILIFLLRFGLRRVVVILRFPCPSFLAIYLTNSIFWSLRTHFFQLFVSHSSCLMLVFC